MNLPDTITLRGDLYNFYEVVDGDKVVYNGPTHSDTHRETLEFIRTSNKRSGADYGVRRGFIRRTSEVDTVDANGEPDKAVVVSSMAINWPVGISSEAASTMIQTELIGIWTASSGGYLQEDPAVSWSSNGLLLAVVAFFEHGQI
jgi:hypothetical protein